MEIKKPNQFIGSATKKNMKMVVNIIVYVISCRNTNAGSLWKSYVAVINYIVLHFLDYMAIISQLIIIWPKSEEYFLLRSNHQNLQHFRSSKTKRELW